MRLPTLTEGRLVQRRNRFVAEVEIAGAVVDAHCPNTGSLFGCKAPGSRVWLSPAENPERKLRWTWEIVEAVPGVLVGLHTGRPNGLVEEALRAGGVPALAGYTGFRREVRYGRENSRIDLLLEADTVTERGARHLREMMGVVADGARAALVFCVQRGDVTEVRPADAIDPVYGQTLREALSVGVEAYALGAEVTPAEIILTRSLPVVTPGPPRL